MNPTQQNTQGCGNQHKQAPDALDNALARLEHGAFALAQAADKQAQCIEALNDLTQAAATLLTPVTMQALARSVTVVMDRLDFIEQETQRQFSELSERLKEARRAYQAQRQDVADMRAVIERIHSSATKTDGGQ